MAGLADDAESGSSGEIEVPVSAIEHYSYCPRQCALIHVEQVYEDNLYTVRGSLTHERVHSGDDAPSRGVEVRRGLGLFSVRYGLVGKADLVELRSAGPYPVEYKSGRRHGPHADLQLCAQALCLEEMYGVPVTQGAIYYHSSQSRHEVSLDVSLREATVALIAAVRELLIHQCVPAAVADARCRHCSLVDVCLPEIVTDPAHLRGLQGALFRPLDTVAEE